LTQLIHDERNWEGIGVAGPRKEYLGINDDITDWIALHMGRIETDEFICERLKE
jgi:hypothetical protein